MSVFVCLAVVLFVPEHILELHVQSSSGFCECLVYLQPWLGSFLAVLCYMSCTSGFTDTVVVHIVARNRRRDNGVYSTRVNRGQHGFDTSAHTQTDAPWAVAGTRGRSLLFFDCLVYSVLAVVLRRRLTASFFLF